jgi:hypothetical protein
MELISIFREIKLKDLELFILREGYHGKIVSYMLLIDFNRASTLDDYPYLKGIEDENGFGRSNFIKVIFFSNNPLTVKVQHDIAGIAEGFLGKKHDCDWNADFEVVSNENYDRDKIIEYIDTYMKNKYDLNINLKNIPYSKFKHLSQD